MTHLYPCAWGGGGGGQTRVGIHVASDQVQVGSDIVLAPPPPSGTAVPRVEFSGQNLGHFKRLYSSIVFHAIS